MPAAPLGGPYAAVGSLKCHADAPQFLPQELQKEESHFLSDYELPSLVHTRPHSRDDLESHHVPYHQLILKDILFFLR